MTAIWADGVAGAWSSYYSSHACNLGKVQASFELYSLSLFSSSVCAILAVLFFNVACEEGGVGVWNLALVSSQKFLEKLHRSIAEWYRAALGSCSKNVWHSPRDPRGLAQEKAALAAARSSQVPGRGKQVDHCPHPKQKERSFTSSAGSSECCCFYEASNQNSFQTSKTFEKPAAHHLSMDALMVHLPVRAGNAHLQGSLCTMQALYQLQRGPMLSATGGHPDERALLQGLFINAAPQVQSPPPQHSQPPKTWYHKDNLVKYKARKNPRTYQG